MRGRKSASPAPTTSPSIVARLHADEATAQHLADIIVESLDPEGMAVSAYEGRKRWVLEVHFSGASDQDALRCLVAREAGARAAEKLVFQKLAAADWVKASLQGLQPVEAGRFVVHGAHARARIPVNRIAIEIEAALAFGTGHHGTTRGCLLALDALVKRRKNKPVIPGRRQAASPDKRASILDIGTGSGVLAIAAARALRSRVLASDIDATAVRIARSNIRRNRCGALVEALAASGVAAQRFRQRAPYELIFANILAEPLQRMAAPAARLLARGGVAILSGLLPKQANAVIAACRAQALSLERRIVLDNWVTLVMRRR